MHLKSLFLVTLDSDRTCKYFSCATREQCLENLYNTTNDPSCNGSPAIGTICSLCCSHDQLPVLQCQDNTDGNFAFTLPDTGK